MSDRSVQHDSILRIGRIAAALFLPILVATAGGAMGGGAGVVGSLIAESFDPTLESAVGAAVLFVIGGFYGSGVGILGGLAAIPLARVLPGKSLIASGFAGSLGGAGALSVIVHTQAADLTSEFQRPFVLCRVVAGAAALASSIWFCGRRSNR